MTARRVGHGLSLLVSFLPRLFRLLFAQFPLTLARIRSAIADEVPIAGGEGSDTVRQAEDFIVNGGASFVPTPGKIYMPSKIEAD